MLVRSPARVDRVLTLTGVPGEVLILDLDPATPSPALLDCAPRGVAA
jgi:hypothetical protein